MAITEAIQKSKNENESSSKQINLVSGIPTFYGRTLLINDFAYKFIRKGESLTDFQKEMHILSVLKSHRFKSSLPEPIEIGFITEKLEKDKKV